MTAAGPTLDRADVLITGGRIAAVGPDLVAPPSTEVLDVSGRWITPGLIDCSSPIGRIPAADRAETGPAAAPSPARRADGQFWAQDPALRAAASGGVTLIHVLPRSASAIGGQGVSLHVRPGRSVATLRVDDGPRSMELACDASDDGLDDRADQDARARQLLERARAYPRRPAAPIDYGLLALGRVLRREIPVQSPCSRADRMQVWLELLAEFGVRPRAFHRAVEAYKIRDTLARSEVAAVVPADVGEHPSGTLDALPASAALLDAAGVRVALHASSSEDVQRLNQQAARALASGLRAGLLVDRDRAIRWITANPAWVLGLEDRYGTIEPGKWADLAIWSADPFSVYAHAELVLIAGERVFERADARAFPRSDFELVRSSAPRPDGADR